MYPTTTKLHSNPSILCIILLNNAYYRLVYPQVLEVCHVISAMLFGKYIDGYITLQRLTVEFA